MKQAAIAFTGACLYALSSPAQNLAPNSSFEEVNICTEYTAPCAPRAWVAVSPAVAKMQYLCNGNAMQGDHFVSLPVQGPDNARVYIQSRLLCPLQKGETYRVRFYISNRNYPLQIGIRFDTAFVFREKATPLTLPATLQLTENDRVKKLPNRNHVWYILEKQYTATESATHIIIGDFTAARQAGNPRETSALAVDSISIMPVNGSGQLCDSANSIRKHLYAQRERHTIPLAYLPPGKVMVQTLNGRNNYDTILFKDDLFLAGNKELNPRYQQRISEVLQQYRRNTRSRIILLGYAYQPKSEKYNEIISYDKAKALATYLVYQQGYSFEDFEIIGMGNRNPRSGENDRVEMVLCKPAAPVVVAVPKPDTLVIPDILFRFNSSELNTALYPSLDSLLHKLPANGTVQLQIDGHTDNKGTTEYNQSLSLRRAAAVAPYLQKSGRGDDIREISGKGELSPVAGNDTAEGRRKNRRVEIIIYHTAN